MYCSNCGKEVAEQAVMCVACGVPPKTGKKFCNHCGSPIQPDQAMCTKCGVLLGQPAVSGGKTRLAAGLFSIFLGWLGIHKFYLGYNKEGLIMLLVSLIAGVVTCGVASTVIGIIAIIEGIIYLTKTDEEFARMYVQGRKGWF